MMRIQYDTLILKLYQLINEELEIETDEGRKAFVELSQKLHDIYIDQKKAKALLN